MNAVSRSAAEPPRCLPKEEQLAGSRPSARDAEVVPNASGSAAKADPVLVTGYGQSDTHALTLSDGNRNPNSSAGTPYAGISLHELEAMIEAPQSRDKSLAQWFIPSDYRQHDARCHQVQRDQGAFWFLALDIDENNLNLPDVLACVSAVTGACGLMIYSTSSATAVNRKWRVLVPLNDPIAGADYSDTARAYFDLLEDTDGGALIPDRALERPGQLIYLPNKMGDFYEHHIGAGSGLDLTANHAIIKKREATRAALKQAAEAAQEARSKRKAAQPIGTRVTPIDAFNAAHQVADLLSRYGYKQLRQSSDWKSPYQSGSSYATHDYGDYWISLSGSDAAAGMGSPTKDGYRHGDAFDLFRHYDHGGDFTQAVKAYAEEAGFSLADTPVPEPRGRKTGGESKPSGKAACSEKLGGFDLVKGAHGRVVWCAENASIMLEHHPDWAGVFAYDEFEGVTMLQKPTPGSKVPKSTFHPRPIKDSDLTAVLRWFNRNGFPDATRMTVDDVVDAAARANVVSPVQNYLNGLVWDRKPRVADWLTTYCGAVPSALICKQGQAWLVSAVARALDPGCKADCALILEGSQGVGKSSVLAILAGEKWFFDGLHDMHSKDASAALRGKWIIELPELSAMKRSDAEAIKAFLSRKTERFRPAYGRREVTEPRRCVFAGTTNRTDWLSDDTGGRRFWPVVVPKVDRQALARDRDQIWAEAVALYKGGAEWWMAREDEVEAAAVVALRASDDPWTTDVLNAVDGLSEAFTRDVFRFLGIGLERQTKADTMRISGILTRAGWINNGKSWGATNRGLTRYVPPTPGGNL